MTKNPELSENNVLSEGIHERGGLTIEHWQDILERDSRSLRYRDPRLMLLGSRIYGKALHYASAVVKGEFPDSGFHHRNYLGRRHWEELARINPNDLVMVPRR